METKYLTGSLGEVELAEGVTGVLERWRKLSLALDDPELRKHGRWIAIAKDRWLRRMAFRDGALRGASGDARLEAGCGIELTHLRIEGAGAPVEQVTFGFEAFGPPERLLEILLAACREEFSGGGAVELQAGWSLGYPAWLCGAIRAA